MFQLVIRNISYFLLFLLTICNYGIFLNFRTSSNIVEFILVHDDN